MCRALRYLLSLFALVSLGASGLLAAPVVQQGTITGLVVDDATSAPLGNAQIYIPGTEYGTLSSNQGRYLLTNVPAGTYQLSAELIGYRTVRQQVEVRANATAEINFQLSGMALALDEIVVTATGEQRVRELGNAIARVDAAQDFLLSGQQTIGQLLQGRAAGVLIEKSAGSVGTVSAIKIRGASSMSLTTRPIVYLDGARINSGTPGDQVSGQSYDRLNSINPEDIESIEIVKGPAAATLYGTEAAGGVIRIRTKRGGGAPRYTVRATYGATWNSTEWPNSVYNPLKNFANAPDTVYQINPVGTEKPFRTGQQYNVGGSLSGGSETISYFASADYQDLEGVTHINWVKQFNGRVNLSITPSDKLSFQFSNGFTRDYTALPNADNNVEGYIASSQLSNPWMLRISRPDPNTGGAPIETCVINFENSRSTGTPLAELGLNNCSKSVQFAGYTYDELNTLEQSKRTERYIGSATVNFRPWDFWSNVVTLGYDMYSDRFKELVPSVPDGPFGSRSDGKIERDDRVGRNLTFEATSGVEYLYGGVDLKTSVGVQYFAVIENGTYTEGLEFPTGAPSLQNSVTKTAEESFSETRTLGFFAQQQFGWKNRLFITPAIRFDENSAFGSELGVEKYPRVSVSWVASEEEWVPEVFGELKLRAAWGQSGKQPGTTHSLALLTPRPVVTQGVNVLAITRNQPGNPLLKPERGEELELGFDVSSLSGNLSLALTFYAQTTKDVLVQRPLAPSEAFRAPKWENVAEMKNKGLEADVQWRALETRDHSWDWQVTFAWNDNEITELPVQFQARNRTQLFKEGSPFASFFSNEIRMGADGVVTTEDSLSFRGKPLPTYEGGVGTTVSLFGDRLTLYAFASYAFDRQLHNFEEQFRCQWGGGGAYGGICPEMEERNPDGTFTDAALIKQHASRTGGSSVSAAWPFTYDADYIRLRSVSATVRLPSYLMQRIGVSDGTLRVAGQNLWLWTKYPGSDPEINEYGQDAPTDGQPSSSQQGRLEVGNRQFFALPIVPTVSATLRLTF